MKNIIAELSPEPVQVDNRSILCPIPNMIYYMNIQYRSDVPKMITSNKMLIKHLIQLPVPNQNKHLMAILGDIFTLQICSFDMTQCYVGQGINMVYCIFFLSLQVQYVDSFIQPFSTAFYPPPIPEKHEQCHYIKSSNLGQYYCYPRNERKCWLCTVIG